MRTQKEYPTLKMEWLLTLAGITLLVYAYASDYLEQHKLKKEGRMVRGVVIDSDEGSEAFHVEYLFPVDGNRMRGETMMHYNLNMGDSISILFLPSDPHINRPVSQDSALHH